jgi:hypothetical protein
MVPELQHGKIACPHCGNIETADADTYYLCHQLTPEQETRFNINFPFVPRRRLDYQADTAAST